jgi:hypothetical protein
MGKGDTQFKYKCHTSKARLMCCKFTDKYDPKKVFLECLKAQNVIQSSDENPALGHLFLRMGRGSIRELPKSVLPLVHQKIENEYALRSLLTTCKRVTRDQETISKIEDAIEKI